MQRQSMSDGTNALDSYMISVMVGYFSLFPSNDCHHYPIAGIVQGNGIGPLIWVVGSFLLSNILQEEVFCAKCGGGLRLHTSCRFCLCG